MKRKLILYSTLTLTLLQTACSNWLDVEPKTAVKEKDLFSTEQGFKENLTGIYLLMTSQDLYGRELLYGITDILAQCYEPGGSSEIQELRYADEDWYKFPTTKNEMYVNSIWKNMYNVIANVNNFLTYIDKNREVIKTPDYYEIMKGEALGLRAYLYFDLLRLYGPIYSQHPNDKALPYRTEFNRKETAFSTAKEVISYIKDDLREAEILLEKDPMNIEFPVTANDQTLNIDDFLRYRFKRMNRYAVKALLARVSMWDNDTETARTKAQEVIDAKDADGNNYFALVADNASDRIYSTELLFSLSVDKFDEQVETDFQIAPFSTTYFIYDKTRIDQIFDITNDGANDMRYREGQGFSFSSKSGYCVKYSQKGAYSFAITNTVPLIRLSEMYYILAECEPDLARSAQYLSQVRSARGIDEVEFLNAEEKKNQIMKEYRKEFYAEGQLWYFYKRNAYPTFLNCPLNNMQEVNYRFSIPDNEKEFGIVD